MKHLVAIVFSIISWLVVPAIFSVIVDLHENDVIEIFYPNLYVLGILYSIVVLWPMFIIAANLVNLFISNSKKKLNVLIYIYLLQVFVISIICRKICYDSIMIFVTLTILYGLNYIVIDKITKCRCFINYEARSSISRGCVVAAYIVAVIVFILLAKEINW